MKIPSLLSQPNHSGAEVFSRAFISHTRPNLTNASFLWHPSAATPENPTHSSVSVALASNKHGCMVVATISRSLTGFGAKFIYYTPSSARHSKSISVALNEPVYVELDIDSKAGKVVYWINDKGMDMGVLDGFKGGADRVRWLAAARGQLNVHGGELTDCAVATEAGWEAAAFRDEHVDANQLHTDHIFKVSSHNSIVFGYSPSLA
jgi:hypothetical protein